MLSTAWRASRANVWFHSFWSKVSSDFESERIGGVGGKTPPRQSVRTSALPAVSPTRRRAAVLSVNTPQQKRSSLLLHTDLPAEWSARRRLLGSPPLDVNSAGDGRQRRGRQVVPQQQRQPRRLEGDARRASDECQEQFFASEGEEPAVAHGREVKVHV